MQIVTIVVAAVAALLFLSQLMCGMWIKSKGADEGAKGFHSRLGIANVLAGLTTSALAIITAAG